MITVYSSKFTMKLLFPRLNPLSRVIMVCFFLHLKHSLTRCVGTIFAYGQTGCGKTHTMIGNLDDDGLRGIMPKSFHHIFSAITSEQFKDKQFLIRCSFIEIYNEDIRDLLSNHYY